MAKSLTFEEVMFAAAKEFHNARHMTVKFPGVDEESALLDAGWSAGALFGIRLALTYPRLAAKLNRAVFEESAPVNLGIDMVAEVLSAQFFPPTVTIANQQTKWDKLREEYRPHD